MGVVPDKEAKEPRRELILRGKRDGPVEVLGESWEDMARVSPSQIALLANTVFLIPVIFATLQHFGYASTVTDASDLYCTKMAAWTNGFRSERSCHRFY